MPLLFCSPITTFTVVVGLYCVLSITARRDPTNPNSSLGPFTTSIAVYPLNSGLINPLEDQVSVWYPTGVKDGSNVSFDYLTFKFISYAHGATGGGIIDVPVYTELLSAMASFGYVIGVTHQCDLGCVDDCQSLDGDPLCFGNYYKKQLAVFDWAKACSNSSEAGDCATPFTKVDWSQGVGVAGHSMGGQATMFSSSYNNATDYDIRAAVMHHAFSHTFVAPTIPFLDFTGEADLMAPVDTMAIPLYKTADGSKVPRGLIDKTKAGHHEPDVTSLDRNGIELCAQFSAAWFKLYLDKTPCDYGIDFNAMIYGTGVDGICSGGDGEMTMCKFDGHN